MGDEVRKAQVEITSTYDGKGTDAAAAAQEKLTNTGAGLATQLPNLDAATKAYTISTEAEYLAVQKTRDALAENIVVRKAAGLALAEQEERLAALNAALGTEMAQSMAAEIENTKLAAASTTSAEAAVAEANAKRAAAAAKLEDAAATGADTAATEEQILVSRKALTLFDELSRGQRGQLMATLGSLLKPGGALAGQISLAELLPLVAVVAGIGMGINDWAKWLIQVNEEFQEVDKAADKSQEAINQILAAGGNVNDEFVDMGKYMGNVAAQADSTAAMLRQMTLAAREYDDAMEEAADNAQKTQDGQNDVDSARIAVAEASGKITKAQATDLREQLDLKKKVQEIDAPAVRTQADIAKTQGEINNAKKDAAKLPAEVDAKTAADAAKAKEARDAALIKDLPKVEGALDKESAESTKVAQDAIHYKSSHEWYNPLNWFDHAAHMMLGDDKDAVAANAARQRAIAKDRVNVEVGAASARLNLPCDTQAATDATSIQKKSEDLAKTIGELGDNLARLNAKLSGQQKDEAGQAQVAAIASDLQREASALSSAREKGTSLADVLKILIEVLKDLQKNHASASDIEDLRQTIASLQTQIDRTRSYATSPN
jgi:hypothetical protein